MISIRRKNGPWLSGDVALDPSAPLFDLHDTCIHDPLVLRTIEFVEGHVTAGLTLQGLGRTLGCSPSTLKRHFRQAVGAPVHRYHLHTRIRLAAGYLLSGRSVKETMALAGFKSRSTFTKRFAAQYGQPPRRWALRVTRARDARC